jgi:hypothetical protein
MTRRLVCLATALIGMLHATPDSEMKTSKIGLLTLTTEAEWTARTPLINESMQHFTEEKEIAGAVTLMFGTQVWIDPLRKRIYLLLIQRANLPNLDASDIRRDFQNAAAR